MRQRVVSAAIGIPIVVACLLAQNSIALGVLLALVAALALQEGEKLCGSKVVWIAGAVLAAVGLTGWWAAAHGYLPIWIFSATIGSETGQQERWFDASAILLAILSGLSMAAPFALAGTVRFDGHHGRSARGVAIGVWIVAPLLVVLMTHAAAGAKVIMAIVPIWAGDTAAIFAGRQWGRRKLAPAISPGKTWEGAIAGLIASVSAAAVLALALSIAWPTAIGCGILAGILGPAGDLLESRLKREAGVKDSGKFLPGHGGVLDRIDSLLLAAPACCALIIFG